MKDICIFVASSKELVAERNALAFLVLAKEEEFEKRGFRVRLSKWEYVDPTMTEARTEDRYLEEMYDSDAALILFKTLIGKYTREEMEKALAHEKGGYSRLKTHRILFKEGDGVPTPELAQWRAELAEGDYGTFTDTAGLERAFLALVDDIAAREHLREVPGGSMMRRISAFLSADDELVDIRNEFADTVLNLNDLLEKRNLRVSLRFGGPSDSGEELRAKATSSEMALALYGTSARVFGPDEMDFVYDRIRRKDGNPKRLYVFFRDDEGKELPPEFKAFRDSFVEKLGHFVCPFGGADQIRLSFLLSLERYAGETVEIYSTVQAPTAPRFVGREDELRRLHELLTPIPGKYPAGRLPIVTGGGGTGKSELIRQFASQFRVQYPGGVFQVDMEHAKSWDDAFRGILKGTPNNGISPKDCLGLAKTESCGHDEDGGQRGNEEPDGSQVRDALLKRAREAGPVLLVLDNVEGCMDLLGRDGGFAQAFPAGFSERVLVNVVATARVCDARVRPEDWAVEMPLGDLSPEAALELLLADNPAKDEAERAAAKRITELLGCRALYLRRVPALIGDLYAEVVCDSYAELEKEIEANLLGTVAAETEETHLPDVLWKMTSERLTRKLPNGRPVVPLGEACVRLAQCASFFSPDGFARHILRHLWDTVVAPDQADEAKFNRAVEILKRHNVFQSTDPIKLHRLDRAAILQTAKEGSDFAEQVTKSLAEYGLLSKNDWLGLCENLTFLRHLPVELRGDSEFWVQVLIGGHALSEECPWEMLEGGQWSRVLQHMPQLSDRCPWEKLDGWDWGRLLGIQPQFSDRCAWEQMDFDDWYSLLVNQPQFAERCPWERFDDAERSRLVSLLPQYSDRCRWENLSGHDWGALLCHQPQFAQWCEWKKLCGEDWCALLLRRPSFAAHCDWQKLAEVSRLEYEFASNMMIPKLGKVRGGGNWRRLLCCQPELASFCEWDCFDGNDWCELLAVQPQFASRCVWEKLSGEDWCKLLSEQPQFATYCNWEKLTGNNWSELLAVHPQFSAQCKWEMLSGSDWSGLLAACPSFSERCPWERLEGSHWVKILSERPALASHCRWDKLDGTDWSILLRERPQFADRCDWQRFRGWDWVWFLQEEPSFSAQCNWSLLTPSDWELLLVQQPQFVDKCPWVSPLEKLASCPVGVDADWKLPLAIVQKPELLAKEGLAVRFEGLLKLDEDGRQYEDRGESSVVFSDEGKSLGSVNPWAFVLYWRPELAERCTTFEKFNGWNRCILLMKQPQFADKWSMEELADPKGACWANLSDGDFEDAWEKLLSAQPQFAKWRERTE